MIVLSYMCFQKEKILARNGGRTNTVLCAKDRLSLAEYRNWLNEAQADSKVEQGLNNNAPKRYNSEMLESRVTLRDANEILAEINSLQGLYDNEHEMANRRFSLLFAESV